MNRDLLVIVVSRSRPAGVLDLMRAWEETSTGRAALLLAVDDDDPALPDYAECFTATAPDVPVLLSIGERHGFAPRLSEEAHAWCREYPYLASWGDDHRPRTAGWDAALCGELERIGTGVVYGDDRVHGEAIPTAWAQTSNMVRALGWMTPPGLQHMFVDNAAKDLGEAVGGCSYLPDVIVEHLHPITGRVEWDDLYREGAAHMHPDEVVYQDWKRHRLPTAARIVREYVDAS